MAQEIIRQTNQPRWKGREIRILPVSSREREDRVRDAVAGRAYQIFESHGCTPGHESQDWKQAEAEVIRPLACGMIVRDDCVSLITDLAGFAAGSVEILVEPRRVSIRGKPSSGNEVPGVRPCLESVFWQLELPVEVDPVQAKTKLNGRILEIDLPKLYLTARAA